jgi:hypothetical protein
MNIRPESVSDIETLRPILSAAFGVSCGDNKSEAMDATKLIT